MAKSLIRIAELKAIFSSVVHGKRRASKGAFSIIELMLALFVFTLFSTGVLYLSLDVLQRDAKLPVYNEALLYAQEGLEASRNIRDQNFLNLVPGTYGLAFGPQSWYFEGSSENIDSYYDRSITIENVYRDASGDIAESGEDDPEIKKITSTVTWMWKGIFPKSISLSTYLSAWTGDEWMISTCPEFLAGDFNNTDTVNTASPPSDNCALQLQFSENIGDFYQSVDIGDRANDVETEGSYAYVASDKGNGSLVVVDVSDSLNPIVLDKENLRGKARYVSKDGNYVYAGVQSYDRSIAVVNVSDPGSPSVESYVNLGAYGNKSERQNNYLFAGINSDTDAFNVIDISNPSSPSLLSSLNVGESINYVTLDGNYAYLGVDDDDAGFQIVDISNPSSPNVISSMDLGDEVNSIELYGSFAFLALDSSTYSLQVVDISDPNNPTLLAKVNTGGKIRDLAYFDSYVYVAQNDVNNGLAIVNASSPIAPYLVDTVNILGKATGVSIDNDMVYLSLDVNNRGLVILETVEGNYASSGDYVSDVLDTGSSDTRFNYLKWDATVPGGTSLKFQIRTASTRSGINSATWVGPDGSNSSYFESSRTIITPDPSASGTRYFQVKAYMTSNQTSTPSVESISVNYNP